MRELLSLWAAELQCGRPCQTEPFFSHALLFPSLPPPTPRHKALLPLASSALLSAARTRLLHLLHHAARELAGGERIERGSEVDDGAAGTRNLASEKGSHQEAAYCKQNHARKTQFHVQAFGASIGHPLLSSSFPQHQSHGCHTEAHGESGLKPEAPCPTCPARQPPMGLSPACSTSRQASNPTVS